MRSRYTAHNVGAHAHLENSLSAEARKTYDPGQTDAGFSGVKWLGLEIRSVSGGGEGDSEGEVEFIARFRQNGTEDIHHERASFIRENGRWAYLDGVLAPKGKPRQVVKVGRNDPCTCGSGKKFKKCCGA